ncbi:uncharacterized protein GIQ15_01517 [Arthroderma uncinatum]|uniref:uncharacterized protein n=1 Tax=Arthroderma uncinatum TaxID=74035 RepID=UPI00144A93BC|nr:uncharacterized protein GIQ15_01517 [Arthroderma uncinatum]KAF3492000.1 hypothetical protein GIQ15_01517 [Arthroderma uncinatum]
MHPATSLRVSSFSALFAPRVRPSSALVSSRGNTVSLLSRPQVCLRSQVTLTRSMATAAPSKKEWIVMMPDKPGMLAKRVEVRNTHLQNLSPILDSGFLKMGGSTLDHHPAEGENPPPMNGSALVVAAETAEEVREILSKDIYATSGVWDVENVIHESTR